MSLVHRLDLLESAGLVQWAQTQPDLEYAFRHALVQEAAYRSLVKPDRRQLHQAVAEALERIYADRAQELAPLLAHHFVESGEDERALKYYALAGDAAARAYANVEAAAHYTRAIEIAERRQPDAAQITHLYLSLGQTLELSARHAEALARYADLERIAGERGDRAMKLSALMARAKVYATLNPEQDPSRAQELLEHTLSLARELGDRRAECKVLWNLMLVHLWGGGDPYRAIEYGEASLALARQLDLSEQVAFSLNDLSYAYSSIGRWPAVQAALDESRTLWRALGNLPMLADNLANSVLVRVRAAEYQPAIDAADEALDISRSIGNVWGQAGSQTYIGLVYFERGEMDRAIWTMEEAIRLGDQVGHPAPIATRCDLAWVYATLGDFRRAFDLVNRAQQNAGESHFLRVMPLAVRARLGVQAGDLDSAAAALEQGYRELKPHGLQWFAPILLPLADAELALAQRDAVRALERLDGLLVDLSRSQTRYLLPDVLYLRGRTLLAIGPSRLAEAGAVLTQARAEAEAVGSRRMLWPTLVALSEIEVQRGHATDAASLRRQAHDVAEFIADHITMPELRASFLHQPAVRQLTSAM